MRTFEIYKITYPNDKVKIYKQLKEFYDDYKILSNDTKTYDNFRYIILNKLYNSDKEYIHGGVKKNYKLQVKAIEKHNFKEFLQEFIDEYNVIKTIKDSKYTQSTQFYCKFFNLAKHRIEAVTTQ